MKFYSLCLIYYPFLTLVLISLIFSPLIIYVKLSFVVLATFKSLLDFKIMTWKDAQMFIKFLNYEQYYCEPNVKEHTFLIQFDWIQ